jgi:hypothetical protein
MSSSTAFFRGVVGFGVRVGVVISADAICVEKLNPGCFVRCLAHLEANVLDDVVLEEREIEREIVEDRVDKVL